MRTQIGQLTFCTNIFPGETWEDHFTALKGSIPSIKQHLSPEKPFGIGLRLSNKASLQLSKVKAFREFREWLSRLGCYVFTINGFPYGNFHHSKVKDQVHAPDWTTYERLQYTLRLFKILAELLPIDMTGGISTSPLSYKYWWDNGEATTDITDKCTRNVIQGAKQLYRIHSRTGKLLHLDIEPEGDGILENANEFIAWYLHRLLPLGIPILQNDLHLSHEEAEKAIRKHIQLCYDVCHFAVEFEDSSKVLKRLKDSGISIGKLQLSSALKINIPISTQRRKNTFNQLRKFNGPTYLHQVVARKNDGQFLHYPDLSEALKDTKASYATEWRSHFHVPLFIKEYGLLGSTQKEIIQALRIQAKEKFTDNMEIETYTWDVLPDKLKLPIVESIIREMKWVMNQIRQLCKT